MMLSGFDGFGRFSETPLGPPDEQISAESASPDQPNYRRRHSFRVSGGHGAASLPNPDIACLRNTHGLHSSSFLGLPYRILYMNPKKELLWSL